MNPFFGILAAILGRLITSTITASVERLVSGPATGMQTQNVFRSSREDTSTDDWPLISMNSSEVKRYVTKYSGYITIDLIFEVIKTVVVYFTGWMTASHDY